jgi:hypothetical protein
MSTTTFENAKVGDRVWSIVNGLGVIFNIQDTSIYDYPLIVAFDDDDGASYTISGLKHKSESRTLFWDEIKFEAPPQPPRMKLIHGVEVPDISFTPKHGEVYAYPNPLDKILHGHGRFYLDELHQFRAKNSTCYPHTEEGKQTAILHAKAMLGIKE